jgi:hypothetical protein
LNGFSNSEREDFKTVVLFNILANTVALLEASQKLGTSIDPKNQAAAQRVFSIDAAQDFGENVLEDFSKDLRQLWEDPAIQQCYQRASEFQINDSTE